MDNNQKITVNEEELKQRLTPEQYEILRNKGTEKPFSSPLLEMHDKDMDFTCAVCGNALFKGDAKFDSGTGWPSFDQAIPGSVELRADTSHGMNRTEVICTKCGSHLGHVFDDLPRRQAGGPSGPSIGSGSSTGKRFCINGACLIAEKH